MAVITNAAVGCPLVRAFRFEKVERFDLQRKQRLDLRCSVLVVSTGAEMNGGRTGRTRRWDLHQFVLFVSQMWRNSTCNERSDCIYAGSCLSFRAGGEMNGGRIGLATNAAMGFTPVRACPLDESGGSSSSDERSGWMYAGSCLSLGGGWAAKQYASRGGSLTRAGAPAPKNSGQRCASMQTGA